MKVRMILVSLCALLLVLPVFAEEDSTPTAVSSSPTPNSVVEGYVAEATPTPAPTPELPPLRDDPMIQNVVEIAHRLDQLAESKLFCAYFLSSSVDASVLEAVSYGDHTQPVKAYYLDGQAFIEALYAGADPADIPDFTRFELRRDLVSDLPELLWGNRDTYELYALSMLARYKVFALPDMEGCGLFFLQYQDASPVMVTWEGYNGCVDVGGFFMPDEALAAVTDAEGMTAWFASFGMPEVTFEEVPLT